MKEEPRQGVVSSPPRLSPRAAGVASTRRYCRSQAPASAFTDLTRSSGTAIFPGFVLPPAPCAAIVARVGSIAPACAATFGDGTSPPVISGLDECAAPVTETRFPRYRRMSVPVRRYVVDP